MNSIPHGQPSLTVIKWLTFLMFMMFAMTTDSVGVIIPEVIKEFHLSMTVEGALHYATMAGIAFAGIFLGYLADKLGRKKTIILGLVLFALNSYLFSVGQSFQFGHWLWAPSVTQLVVQNMVLSWPLVLQASFLLACYSTGSSILLAVFLRVWTALSMTSFPSKNTAYRRKVESTGTIC